jgi:hypothetical protein
MANRIRRKPGHSEQEGITPGAGMWAWLKQTENQKTLRFVGAVIAAAIGVLLTVGIIHRPGETTPQAPPSSSAEPQEPVATQSAVANSSGAAVNVQGTRNRVEIGK